ncbi:MAG TPA: hypothetical protein VJB34_03825 [Bdellovibrionota bacterium]|nr:hypothetical protein [Bdellovibrionota bacterium]
MKKQLFLIVFLTVVVCTFLRAQNTPTNDLSPEEIFNRILAAQTFKEATNLAGQKIKIYVLDIRAGKTLGLPVLSDEEIEKLGFVHDGIPRSEIEPCALFEPEINAIVLHGIENYRQDILAREFFFAEVFNNLPEDFLRNFRESPFDAPEEEMRRMAEGIAGLNFLLFDIVARGHDMSPTDFASNVSFHFSEISESIEELIVAAWPADMIRRYLSLVIQTSQRVFPSYACRHITDDILYLTQDDNARIQLLKEENPPLLLQLQLFRKNLHTALRKIKWKSTEEVREPFIYPREIVTTEPRTIVDLSRATSKTLEALMYSHFQQSYPSMELSDVESVTLKAIIKFYVFYSNTLRGVCEDTHRKQLAECISSFNEAVFGWDIYANETKLQSFREFLAQVEKSIHEALPDFKSDSSILEFGIREAEIQLRHQVSRHNTWRFEFTDFQKHALVVLGRLDPATVSQPLSPTEAESTRERIRQAIAREGVRARLPSVTGEAAAREREARGEGAGFRNRIDRFFDGEGPRRGDIRPHR